MILPLCGWTIIHFNQPPLLAIWVVSILCDYKQFCHEHPCTHAFTLLSDDFLGDHSDIFGREARGPDQIPQAEALGPRKGRGWGSPGGRRMPDGQELFSSPESGSDVNTGLLWEAKLAPPPSLLSLWCLQRRCPGVGRWTLCVCV